MSRMNPRNPRQSGQALAEYSVIVLFLTAALVAPIPGIYNGESASFMGLMIKAYQNYYLAFYYVLALPFP